MIVAEFVQAKKLSTHGPTTGTTQDTKMQAEDVGRSNQTAQARVQASQRLKPHAPAAIFPANLNPLLEATVLITRVGEKLDGRKY